VSITDHGPNICLFCEGAGRCSACEGTGTNPHINEPEPKCQRCSGTGVCAQCLGTEKGYVRPPEIQDLGINKL
jgi:hypothetical protein